MNFLGIDIGTGGSRAILIDRNGKLLHSAAADHAPFASPQIGWAEQDPNDWWRAASAAIKEVCDGLPEGSDSIAAIGLSGQMHGAVLLDSDHNVIRPAIIWCDQRTDMQCTELTKQFGESALIDLVSNPALPNMTLTKLLWVREYEPENWARVAKMMLPKDYVRFRMTGVIATDVTDASGTLMLDVKNRRWSSELVSKVGIDQAILPDLYESHEVSGNVTEDCASITGLQTGTPVVAGAGDNAAGAIGMGIVKPHDTSVTIGTSGVAFTVTEHPTVDPNGRIHTFCHAIPDTWHLTGVTQAAGFSLSWFRENFGCGESFDDLVSGAEQIVPGSEGLLWTPYLMGERTPHLDPSARASLIGLTASHTKSHVVRAILEGVAFSLLDCLEIYRELGLPLRDIVLGGGGAKSPLWRQIQADIYREKVSTIEVEEGAAYGAALLAGVGVKSWSSIEEACAATIKIDKLIEPDETSMRLYSGQYRSFKKIYGALSFE